MLRIVFLFFVSGLIGCTGDSGPPSVAETSANKVLLADRVEFVETYVNFRREYTRLEYDIFFQNNGGFPPGPSDWDIRLVAEVSPNELTEWVSQGMAPGISPVDGWHRKIANEIDVSNVSEWYSDGGRSVGIDRNNAIVVYRNHTWGVTSAE